MVRLTPNHPILLNRHQLGTHKIELIFQVPEDLACLKGHFPEFAILPGVVQLQWAADYAQEFLGAPTTTPVVDRLKFTAPIRPNERITLTLEYFVHTRCTEFKYFNTQHNFSQGRLSHG